MILRDKIPTLFFSSNRVQIYEIKICTTNFVGDIVYHKGDYVDELSFVARGILEVLQDGEVVAVLNSGDAFGDTVWRRPLSISPG